ncbi:LacI family DNA-binding transcriptional regulator [Demequina sp. NBRC 110057]|uniref:LacI family DNA-binding transcriptional regulator n=1 Tax=Demequina sp. NBRC 110057 TaxID=1570346 RepID=UPI001F292FA3|nr:LacI family DNA-binding transcriptional regulator [Demequina sp. NBRC 110057]
MSETPRTSPVTLHDVAREAGVSLATASRSLNGSTRNVKAANRERVLEAAQRLGYSANASAQAVARGTSNTVALLVGDIADPYFSSIAAGVVGAAEDHHLIVTMAETRRDPEREVELVRALRGQRPRAIILAASRRAGDAHAEALTRELTTFEADGGRVVFISTADAPFRTLEVDNRGAARALGDRLGALGYRSVAVLAGPANEDGAPALLTSRDRLAGFREGLAGHDVEVADARVGWTAFTRDGGYEGMQALLSAGLDGVELVFAVNDVMAVGAMSALRDAGLEPGIDVAVAGFDDIPTLRDVTPRLTTASLPLERVGEEALALALADGAEAPAPITAEVAIRESTPAR